MAARGANGRHEPPLMQRLGWFVLLWLGGVASVALVSMALRFWLRP